MNPIWCAHCLDRPAKFFSIHVPYCSDKCLRDGHGKIDTAKILEAYKCS